ncbi:MAG: hypothetical protein ACLFV3_05655 [Phycisphaeraceae bacterium]
MSQSEPSDIPHCPSATSEDGLDRFTYPKYVLHRQFFKLLGEALRIYDNAGNLVLYSRMKAFKLKEDIRFYASEAMEQELLVIRQRNILDFAGRFDVIDPATNQTLGTLRRKGLTSMLRDEWALINENDAEVGRVREDSMLHALARRAHELVALLLPQKYTMELAGQPVATIQRGFNPIFQKIEVDFSPDEHVRLDRRLGLAAAVLVAVIEERSE